MENGLKTCIICQKLTSECLRCPKDRVNCDALRVYNDVLENVNEFRRLEALPVAFNYGHQGGINSCHETFTKSRLERAQTRKRKQAAAGDVSDLRRSKRQSVHNTMCIILWRFKIGETS